jgi:TPR repeat protein
MGRSWLRLAAHEDDADAQLWLGTGYQRGWFGTTDYREALKWLRKAAAQGLPTWYRKAADHVPEYLGGVWEAETQLAYLYRDGRLPDDKVQAYMWFAIIGFSVAPPTDDDMKRIAQHMPGAQIVKAQRMAEDWIKRHPRQLPSEVATSGYSSQ